MKRNIAIIAGGDSSEIVVSVKSAKGILSFLDKEKYNPFVVTITGNIWQMETEDGDIWPIDKNDFCAVKDDIRLKFDFAYITIHGTPGEDGDRKSVV